MNDAQRIYAALDHIIDQLDEHLEAASGHPVATQNALVATVKSLTDKATGHSGHPKTGPYREIEHHESDVEGQNAQADVSRARRDMSKMVATVAMVATNLEIQEKISGHQHDSGGHWVATETIPSFDAILMEVCGGLPMGNADWQEAARLWLERSQARRERP